MLRPYEGQSVAFDKQLDTRNGEYIVPAIAVDFSKVAKNAILMVGSMNQAALEITLEKRNVTFWSRSAGGLWTKGATSGNFLKVRDIYVDCDSDAILVDCQPLGPTCHTGTQSCFELPE